MQSASTTHFLRIGTRGSPLAMAQAHEVRQKLCALHGVDEDEIAIIPISTRGDRSQVTNQPLSEFGGKGVFSKEIEDQLLAGTIDLGVHSSKDMATQLPDGLIMPIFLPREDIRDAFISPNYNSLDTLPEGATIGTSSIRRRAQLLHHRPDLRIVDLRGNVGTRLQKLADGVADATLLATAGLNRLTRTDVITQHLDPALFPPAPSQGAIGIEIRADDTKTDTALRPLNHPPTRTAILAERALLDTLDGSCRTPIAALSTQSDTQLTLRGQILSHDGMRVFDVTETGAKTDPATLGQRVGERLRERAGPEFMASFRDKS